jgi:hypothetical protein
MEWRNRDLGLAYDADIHREAPMHLQKCPLTRITSAASRQLTLAELEQWPLRANDWSCRLCHLPLIKHPHPGEMTLAGRH